MLSEKPKCYQNSKDIENICSNSGRLFLHSADNSGIRGRSGKIDGKERRQSQ